LWDQHPSNKATFLIIAIDTYKTSNKHTTVTQAIDELFNEDEGCLFKEAKSSKNPEESAFAKRLLQIALDNRLRTSLPVPKEWIYLTSCRLAPPQ
jgi:hypothetical protein